jgi:hypothetical protein
MWVMPKLGKKDDIVGAHHLPPIEVTACPHAYMFVLPILMILVVEPPGKQCSSYKKGDPPLCFIIAQFLADTSPKILLILIIF